MTTTPLRHHAPPATFECGGKNYSYIDLKGLLGDDGPRLPVVLRLLLENELRHAPSSRAAVIVQRFLAWLPEQSSRDTVSFRPMRMMMEDTTSTPAFVDVAAMRDAVFEAGGDPQILRPVVPIDASTDHSLAVHYFGAPTAAEQNLSAEYVNNAERFSFLRWVGREMQGVTIHSPGTGIMHTLNLEQLATVVTSVTAGGNRWAVPDTVVGTDSHMPLVNGAGVLAWGIGGLEAQATMFGSPIVLRIPDVIGVRLTDSLPSGVLATDLALEVTRRLRQCGVAGEFVEFFGPGVRTLSVGQRCVVASMAPEYGATTGFFPVDDRTLTYFRGVGRPEPSLALIKAYAQLAGLWMDASVEASYTRVIEISLATVSRSVAGPRRPQDLMPYGKLGDSFPQSLAVLSSASASVAGSTSDPRLAAAPNFGGLPTYPVAIAAITSCTNTTDPALLVAAGLLARNARRLGMRVAPWVKTSLAPGSPAARDYLERCGVLESLDALGFSIVGFGCTTCIGNSGALPEAISEQLVSGSIKPVAVLSGNRNFPGRIHPHIELSFIMSAPLVVAFALCGSAQVNLERDPIGLSVAGQPVYLSDIWPNDAEIEACVAMGVDAEDFGSAYARAQSSPLWQSVAAATGSRFTWDETSNYLSRPPYACAKQRDVIGKYLAHPLMVFADDVTTDHIAPGSAIPAESPAGEFLIKKGTLDSELGVFSARRGNWQVMLRATFYNKSLNNLLAPHVAVGYTIHAPSGRTIPIFEAAASYQRDGDKVVLVAGARYGSGSSRDWAAKGPWLLGVRAVLAVSIERIHRQNLIGMGILPLLLPQGTHPSNLEIQPGDRFEFEVTQATLAPRKELCVRLVRASGAIQEFTATTAIETDAEGELLSQGGIIPSILAKVLRVNPSSAPPHDDSSLQNN